MCDKPHDCEIKTTPTNGPEDVTGYISLHNHTHFSLLDALAKPEEAVVRLAEMGQNAYSITDHGNLHGLVRGYEAAQKQGIKFIPGCEFYFTNDHKEKERKSRHITIIAQNNVGLSNLYKLTTWANVPVDKDGGFFYRPRIDWSMLRKFSEGLLCLTGCMNSPSNHAFVHDSYEDGKDHVKHMVDIFGEKRTFVELQNVNDQNNIYIPEQELILNNCRQVAQELGLRSVASNDSHYVNASDTFAHEVLKAIDARATLKTPVVDHSKGVTKGRLVFNGFDYYNKSKEEMLQKFSPEEVQTSQDIADSVNVTIKLGGMKTPKYKGLSDSECMRALKDRCRAHWEDFGIDTLDNRDEYVERVQRELAEVEDAGLQHYFMIVADVCKFCDDNGIIRNYGRGSCAGSLVLYLLQVTIKADPIRYGLIWERFWNHGRKGSMPDVDLDIQIDRREEVIQYLREEFGKDRVLPMITITTMTAKGVIKDVGKVLGLSHEYLNRLTKNVKDKNNGLQDAINSSSILKKAEQGVDEDVAAWEHEAEKTKDTWKKNQLISDANDRRRMLKKTFEIAFKLEGVNRNRSTHACAVLIADEGLFGKMPCVWDAKKKSLLTGFDMYDVEKMGYMKLDVLGLKTLSVVSRALPDFMDNVGDFDNSKVYDLITKGNNKGVFQLESKLGESWARKVKPSNIEELAALISLIRPAVLESGLAAEYLENKNKGEWDVLHEELRPIFETTYGVMLYQEQMLEVVRVFGGFDLKEADMLRKAVGKKIPKLMAQFKNRFLDGCIEKTKNSALAEELWGWIEKGAEYGFNKSHALTYAMMSYTTAFAKLEYPLEFYCALLQLSSNEQKPQEEIAEIFYDSKLRGVEVLPPSIAHSEHDFTVNNGDIYFGLQSIKKVGKASLKTVKDIYKESNDLAEFVIGLKKAKKDVVEALCFAGAFDFMGVERTKLFMVLSSVKAMTPKELKVLSVMCRGGGDVDLSTARSKKVISVPGSDDIFGAFSCFQKWLTEGNITDKVVAAKRIEKIQGIVSDLKDLTDPATSERTMAARELMYLGIPLTYCEVDVYDDVRKTHEVINIKREMANKRFATIAVLSRVSLKQDRNGNQMAFVSLTDKTYMIDAIMFHEAFSKYKQAATAGSVVYVEGKMSRDGTPLINIMQKI